MKILLKLVLNTNQSTFFNRQEPVQKQEPAQKHTQTIKTEVIINNRSLCTEWWAHPYSSSSSSSIDWNQHKDRNQYKDKEPVQRQEPVQKHTLTIKTEAIINNRSFYTGTNSIIKVFFPVYLDEDLNSSQMSQDRRIMPEAQKLLYTNTWFSH